MNITIECKTRPEGSKPRALRREGLIPAALYGHDGSNSISLTIPAKEAQLLLKSAAANNTLIDIKVPEISWQGQAIIREVQAHPWKKTLNHLSFFSVSSSQILELVVPVVTVGKAIGVKQGGVVEQVINELNITCAADKIPESIEINIEDFEIGKILHVGEVVLPEGITVLDDPDAPVISVVIPTQSSETEEETAEASSAS